MHHRTIELYSSMDVSMKISYSSLQMFVFNIDIFAPILLISLKYVKGGEIF